MDASFERHLEDCRGALERFVRFKITSRADADDVMQETLIAAYRGFDSAMDAGRFKAYLLGVARHKIADHYRLMAKQLSLPLEAVRETALCRSRFGLSRESAVLDTLDKLGDLEKQVLYLYYFKDMAQADIAARLSVPLGTVKSRLHTAKARFRALYPCPPKTEGEIMMKTMPMILPPYTIETLEQPPFPVRWEELMGWFIVPRLGESCAWAMYDLPERKRTEHTNMTVMGRAEVHGVEGVEIVAVEHEPMDCNRTDGEKRAERRFVAQLTDTHCRILAESHVQDGVKLCYTFLDGDAFLSNWGFGEDNCGNEVVLSPKGDITREGSAITTRDKRYLLDVVGRYAVTIGGKTYDTVCVIDAETYNEGVMSEQFLDENGRTVLWRRFNRDDWALKEGDAPWSKRLPDNERVTVNGDVYVHWYDCITDYIL